MAEIVKLEVGIDHPSLCHGCLSQGRKTFPIPPGEFRQMFLYLVTTQFYTDVEATKLCWECMAMLRRFIIFRNRIFNAQNTLMMLYHMNTSIPTLSNLRITSKVDFDQSYEFISELPTQDKTLERNVELEVIKTEEIPDRSIKELDNQNIEEKIDYKVENDFDNIGFDSDTNTEIEINKVKKQQNKKSFKLSEKQKQQRKLKEKMKHNFIEHATVKTMNTNWTDEKNFSQYFTDEYLDENQIDEFVKRTQKRSCYKKCRDCNKKFYVKLDYLRHRNLNHRNGQPDSCLQCKKKFPSLEQLKLHWKRIHSCYSRCNMCHMYCKKLAQKKHLKYNHTKLYCCDKCREELLSPILFNEHYKKNHAKFICDYCSKNFHFKRTLLKHILATHSDHHKCEICHKEFRRKRNLSIHLTRHRELSLDKDREASYCVECDRQYPSVQQYKLHLKISGKHRHLPTKSIPCPECGKIFRRTTYMKNHLYVAHMKEKAKNFCEVCGKYFTTNWGLKVHYKYVHLKLPKPKNDICDLCGRGFASKRILTNHRRTHTGERPHRCQFCSAAFAQKAALRSHQKTQHKDVLDTMQDKVNT